VFFSLARRLAQGARCGNAGSRALPEHVIGDPAAPVTVIDTHP